MTLNVLFHVNHLWGVGHFTRTAAIANAVIEMGGAATILTGNAPVEGRLDPAVRLVELPVIRAKDTSFARIVTARGWPISEEQWTRRAVMIAGVLEAAPPAVLVTETFPFGRRKLAREVVPLIEAARAGGAKIVASLRDIPTPPTDAKRLEECAGRLRELYDAALVHGDPAVTALNEIWPGEIPVPTQMTGYVASAANGLPEHERRGVVVSAGGGGDAAPVLRAALSARSAGLLTDEPWTFITGPHAPEGLFEALTTAANALPQVAVLASASDFPARIASARLSISRGGYNTAAETIAAGCRCIVVPFAPDGEPEQTIRAQAFAARGLLTHMPEHGLTPDRLIAAAEAALAAPPPDGGSLQMDGAAASASRLAEIAGGG